MNSTRIRSAFTTIELLVVIGVVLALLTLSLGSLAGSFERRAVLQGAADFIEANELARGLAMASNGMGSITYGVRVTDSSSTGARIEVVTFDTGTVDVLTENGFPVFQRDLPSNAILMEGDVDLRSGSESLTWLFNGRSATVHVPDSSDLSAYTVTVGLQTPTYTDLWHFSNFSTSDSMLADVVTSPVVNTGTAPGVAAPTTTNPGLWLRSSDGRLKVSLYVFSTGVAGCQELPQ